MSEHPRPGDVFAGHLIEREIGRGGMGIVLLARNVSLDRRRVIKLIAPELSADPAFAARFRRESRLAASVEHPNVVGVFHAGEEDGLLYLVMPYIEGSDLARLLADGPLEPARAARIVSEVAAGLDAAHAAGLVHRDVKPANILIAPGAGPERVYLTDFGISKPVSSEGGSTSTGATALTGFGEVLGTAGYTAPEQIEDGRSDARSDVYSLACVAFQALTGRAPFERDTELATLIAHTKAPRPLATDIDPGLPAAIDEALSEGMAIDPAARPPSAGSFARRIEAALEGQAGVDPSTAPTPTAVARPGSGRSRPARRSLAGIVVAGLLAAALAAVALVLLSGGDEDGAPAESAAPTVETSPPGAVGDGPTGVAVGDLRVWVASRDGNEVDRLQKGRPESFADPVDLPEPRRVAVGFNSIWVVNGEKLYRLDPDRGDSEPLPIDVGAGPADVAVDLDYVWVANEEEGTVVRVDPVLNEVTGKVEVGAEPRAVATGKGSVFVASTAAGTISKIDPQKVKLAGEPAAVGGAPTSLAVATDAVWVADSRASTLTRLTPGGLRPDGDPIDVAARPRGVAVGLGSAWVASGAESVVQRFDADDGTPQGEPIEVGADPADIAAGDAAVYTANFGEATVTKITP